MKILAFPFRRDRLGTRTELRTRMGRRVVGSCARFWDAAVPLLFDVLCALGYRWGHVTYYDDFLSELQSKRNGGCGYPHDAWEKGTLLEFVYLERTRWLLHNPFYAKEDCLMLDRVERLMLPCKPPILSQIFVYREHADRIFDFLIKRFGGGFDLVLLDFCEPPPSFDAFLLEVEFEPPLGVGFAESRLDDNDERINLFRIYLYITAAPACPTSFAPARRSGHAAARRPVPSGCSRSRGTSASGCAARRAFRRC